MVQVYSLFDNVVHDFKVWLTVRFKMCSVVKGVIDGVVDSVVGGLCFENVLMVVGHLRHGCAHLT